MRLRMWLYECPTEEPKWKLGKVLWKWWPVDIKTVKIWISVCTRIVYITGPTGGDPGDDWEATLGFRVEANITFVAVNILY